MSGKFQSSVISKSLYFKIRRIRSVLGHDTFHITIGPRIVDATAEVVEGEKQLEIGHSTGRLECIAL